MNKIIKHINQNSGRSIDVAESATVAQLYSLLRNYIKANVNESKFPKKKRVAKVDGLVGAYIIDDLSE